jgi:hypothetical protein
MRRNTWTVLLTTGLLIQSAPIRAEEIYLRCNISDPRYRAFFLLDIDTTMSTVRSDYSQNGSPPRHDVFRDGSQLVQHHIDKKTPETQFVKINSESIMFGFFYPKHSFENPTYSVVIDRRTGILEDSGLQFACDKREAPLPRDAMPQKF